VTLITIDIPIGLPDTGSRAADHAARVAVGPRWQSVFLTPIRAALEAPTYAEANEGVRDALVMWGSGGASGQGR
jgi:predicted RNase H-like nuclease